MGKCRWPATVAGLLTVFWMSFAAAAPPFAGHIRTVRGTVAVYHPSGAMEVGAVGTSLQASDLIRTGIGAGLSFVLRDGTTIVIGPSSELDLKAYSYDLQSSAGALAVRLLKGSMRMITGAIGKSTPEAIRVETQTAVIGIRGTDFIVEVD
ncbi:MAG: hypothetical protein EON54_08760 [Alcaligenaceae bacterium]|nr:MAG: hypothetical protein EON54_08760 [Alcaligenaceae bacterium]